MPQSFSMLLGNLTIATKLRLMAAISTLVLIALSGYLLAEEYQINRTARQTAVRQTVEIGHSILEWAHKLETSGSHTREQAQALAHKALENARYAGNEYFWLQTVDAQVVMHPFRPDLNGKDGSSMKDPDGKPIFTMFAQRARQADGGGLVEYQWPRQGQEQPVPKFAHVKLFQPWGWVVGSGVYVDDLRKSFLASLGRTTVIIGLAIVINLLFIANIRRGIVRGLSQAIAVAKAISQRNLTTPIHVTSQDEVGQLLQAMRTMTHDLRDTLHTVREATDQLAGASQQIMQGALLPVTPEHQGTGQHPEYQHQLIPLLPGGVMLEPGHHHQVDQNALLGLRQPCALPHHPANRHGRRYAQQPPGQIAQEGGSRAQRCAIGQRDACLEQPFTWRSAQTHGHKHIVTQQKQRRRRHV